MNALLRHFLFSRSKSVDVPDSIGKGIVAATVVGAVVLFFAYHYAYTH